MTVIPSMLRIGHLRYRVVEDDALVNEHGVRLHGTLSGWSSAGLQTIALATKSVPNGNAPLGPDYRAEVILHEVLHQCLRATDCDPDRDAKAGCDDVEERTVSAMSGPLLAALRDNPALVAYLLAEE